MVSLIFSSKNDDLFSHRPLQSDDLFSCRILTSPTFRHRLSNVFFLNSATKKVTFSRVALPGWCHAPSDATAGVKKCDI